MPEGPEVKIASNYFNSFFAESKKICFEIITDYYQKKYSNVFNTINSNLKIFKPIYTVGKNMFIDLNDKLIFNFHLGMTGGWNNTLVKHCHFKITNASKELFFKDVRKFGKMKIITKSYFSENYNQEFDLLNDHYDNKKHIRFLEEKINDKKSICSILMNQKYFPGVGNYIKSEALYASRIHPEKPWGKISKYKKDQIIKHLKDIMQTSYLSGGAELKDFKNPFKKSKFKLKIYGKSLTPEKNEVISQVTSDYRKTWFCRKKQKL